MLTPTAAVAQAEQMLEWRRAEADSLEDSYNYLRGKQKLPTVPTNAPPAVRELAKVSRVNLVKLIVGVPAQSLYIDGYRTSTGADEAEGWATWQANKMDARQTGIFRAAIAYGSAYATVLPGEPRAVIKGHSPRYLTAVYGEDPDWPVWALERLRGRKAGALREEDTALYRLYDDEAVYTITTEGGVKFVDSSEHGLGVCPIVRFRNIEDLDDEQVGEIDDSLKALQDQVDLTTFALLVAQHYQSFRQRYVMGWLADTEEDRLKAGASQLWTFEKSDVKVGEFGQVDLSGHLSSREALVELFAVITQTPPQHILGKLVNISAEALVAANIGQERKVGGMQTSFGESAEQTFGLTAVAEGREPDDEAEVVWRDATASSFAQTVDALGKVAALLEVPPEMLWERIPGVTQNDIERWKAERAAAPPEPVVPKPAPQPAVL